MDPPWVPPNSADALGQPLRYGVTAPPRGRRLARTFAHGQQRRNRNIIAGGALPAGSATLDDFFASHRIGDGAGICKRLPDQQAWRHPYAATLYRPTEVTDAARPVAPPHAGCRQRRRREVRQLQRLA